VTTLWGVRIFKNEECDAKEEFLTRFRRFTRSSGAVLALALVIPFFLQAQAKKDRIVVVISLDGFPAYALQDLRLPIPTLRKLEREGAVADSMQPVNPTVTWPNHTTIITGVDTSEHQVLFNGLLMRAGKDAPMAIEPWRDKDVLVHSPTIYDAAHDAGLTTAQVDWVAIYNARTIDWKFPEIPDPHGEIERELIANRTVTTEQLKTFEDSSQAWQDEIWTDAAVKILEEHKPNLLLLHLLTLDDVNHAYGPMSGASLTAMAYLDSQVNRIVEILQRPEFAKRSTLMVVSDHGFRSYKYKIHPNVLLQEKDLLSLVDGKWKGDAWVVPEGGTAMVYVINPDRKAELIPRLASLYAQAEGVDGVYGKEVFEKLGLPTAAQSDQAPDLVLAAKPDYCFTGDLGTSFVSNATGGTHGFLNSDLKMQAIFLAWGAGVPKGVRLGSITNRDVAPTIAKLLGIELKTARGREIPGIGQ
jgi:predicted AlkP superfamily pyrophosphatase or phosphodiesterase